MKSPLALAALCALAAGCHDFDALSSRYGNDDLGRDLAVELDMSPSVAPDLSPPRDLSAGADLSLLDMTAVGHLSGSGAPTASVVDLTAAGTLDWAHWGYPNDDMDHKASAASLIPNYTTLSGLVALAYANNPDGFSWSDGLVTPSVTSTTTGMYRPDAGDGFQLVVPASTVPRTLVVYVGGYRSNGKLTASLSDHSAPDYSDASFVDLVDNIYAATYTLTFNAASAGQTLTITWSASTIVMDGNVSLQAAALR